MMKPWLGIAILGCSLTLVAQAKTVALHFEKGSTSGVVHGSFIGDQTDQYVFYAKKGQLLQIENQHSDPAVQFTLKDVVSQNRLYTVLPHSGKYILVVSQTRNSARRYPTVSRHYKAVVSIKTMQSQKTIADGVQQMDYICEGGQPLTVRYQMVQSSPTQATVQWGYHETTLPVSLKYSKEDFIVFKSREYLLGVTLLRPYHFQYSKVNSLLSFQQHVDGKAILSECVPAIKQDNRIFNHGSQQDRQGSTTLSQKLDTHSKDAYRAIEQKVQTMDDAPWAQKVKEKAKDMGHKADQATHKAIHDVQSAIQDLMH